MDTISDADPFINGANIPQTPQSLASFTFPTSSTLSSETGKKTFGEGDLNSTWIPQYSEARVDDHPEMRPTSLHNHTGKGLTTPADMDGHFLQNFDNYLAKERDKDAVMQKFL